MTAKTSPENTAPATLDAPVVDAAGVTHDRSTTPVSAGRIQFKGHNAAAGYPFRIWEGAVQALVGDEWVDAPDAQPLTAG